MGLLKAQPPKSPKGWILAPPQGAGENPKLNIRFPLLAMVSGIHRGTRDFENFENQMFENVFENQTFENIFENQMYSRQKV